MSFLCLDSETFWMKPGCMAPPLVCVSWFDGKESGILKWDTAEPFLRAALLNCNKDNPLVLHNGCYDMAVFGANFPELLPLIFDAYDRDGITDTLLREKLYQISIGEPRRVEYNLKAMTERYLGETLDKDTWRTHYEELHKVPLENWPQGAIDYPIKDAVSTGKIYLLQKKLDCCFDDEFNQARGAFALQLTSVWGMRTDGKYIEELEAAKLTRMEELRKVLETEGLVKKDGSKTMTAIYERILKANPDCERTPTGKPATDMETLEDLGDPVLNLLGEYTNTKKMFTIKKPAKEGEKEKSSFTFETLKRGVTRPIHTSFDSLKVTGRTGSFNPNFQNVAKVGGIRECFIPREGNIFITADFTAAELHTLGQVCLDLFGYSKLADQLNNKIDVHCTVAAALLGITYDEMYAIKDDKGKGENARALAKIANFGLGGGMGAERFAQGCKSMGFDIDEEQAKKIIATWKETLPEMQEYFDYNRDMFPRVKWPEGFKDWSKQAKTEWKKKLKNSRPELFETDVVLKRSNRKRGKCGYTEACNTPFQAPAGDGTKEALYEVCRACYILTDSPLFGFRPVNMVHDELIIEGPKEKAEEAKAELVKVMVKAFSKWTPDVPVKASGKIMERWSK